MPRFLVALRRDNEIRYIEWSTVVDAPVTYGMTRDELEAYIREEYGREGERALPARLARLDAKGTSSHIYDSADDVMSVNRAGPDETELTPAEIVAAYWDPPVSPAPVAAAAPRVVAAIALPPHRPTRALSHPMHVPRMLHLPEKNAPCS